MSTTASASRGRRKAQGGSATQPRDHSRTWYPVLLFTAHSLKRLVVSLGLQMSLLPNRMAPGMNDAPQNVSAVEVIHVIFPSRLSSSTEPSVSRPALCDSGDSRLNLTSVTPSIGRWSRSCLHSCSNGVETLPAATDAALGPMPISASFLRVLRSAPSSASTRLMVWFLTTKGCLSCALSVTVSKARYVVSLLLSPYEMSSFSPFVPWSA